MVLKKNILAILAIFCVLLSACAVSANTHVDQMSTDSGNYLSSSEDGHNGTIVPPDTNHNEAAQDEAEAVHDGMTVPPDVNHNEEAQEKAAAEEVHNSMILPPDYAHNEAAMANATNSTGHAAGEHTAQAGHTMPATGNPILALMAVSAVLGGASIFKRKK